MAKLPGEFQAHKRELAEAFSETPFIVFLCGPAHPELTAPKSSIVKRLARFFRRKPKPSAEFRKKLRDQLVAAGIEVVLGEDEGLLDTQLQVGGLNAQDNELIFAQRCNAIVVVADSPGSFCELGLFSWHYVHSSGVLNDQMAFMLFVNSKYEGKDSYFNEGPARSVNAFGWLKFVDFSAEDPVAHVEQLKSRRAIYVVDNKRGRPTKRP